MFYAMSNKNMKRCVKSACVMGAMMVGFKLGYMLCRKQVKAVLNL